MEKNKADEMDTLVEGLFKLGFGPKSHVRDNSRRKTNEPACAPLTQSTDVAATRDGRADSILESYDTHRSDDQNVIKQDRTLKIQGSSKATKDSIYSTLFHCPLSQDSTPDDFPPTPTYLFRVYDKNSQGTHDESIIASAASKGTRNIYNQDLLSLEGPDSATKLARHLDWKSRRDTNLISWTGSLLSAVQLAKFRNNYRMTADRIFICVVDTRKFPPNQFRQVNWLLARLDAEAGDPTILEKYIGYQQDGFDNKEYLSQGVMHHQGRSSKFTLQDLIGSGLYTIYPEFTEPSKGWALPVSKLRNRWAYPIPIRAAGLAAAREIAEACFHDVDEFDAVIIILTLRERPSEQLSWAARGTPCEVDRCYKTLQSAKEWWLNLGHNGTPRATALRSFLRSQGMME
jgi:hypothetical protein